MADLYPTDSGELGRDSSISSVNSTILDIASRASKAALNLSLIASRASRTERFTSSAGDILSRSRRGAGGGVLRVVWY